MRLKPRLLVWTSVAILMAILLAATVFLAQEPPPLQVARLPNGDTLRLEAVTYGKRHHFVGGRRWQRLLHAVVPSWRPSSQRELDPATRQTSPGALLFWTSRQTPPWPLSGAHFVIVDEHGCEFDRGVPWPISWGMQEVEAWAVGRFPRRGGHVTLRIYPKGSAAPSPPLAEFTVPNPAPGPYPVWETEALPVSRQDGDLTLTLTALRTGLKEKGPVKPPGWRMGGTWTCATLRMTQNGHPSRDWRLHEVTFTDATGNPSTASYSVPGARGEWHFVCGGSLAPHETAWKLRAEYVRAARFPVADLWTVKVLAVPDRGAFSSAPGTTIRYGATLHLLGLTGPGASLPEVAPESGGAATGAAPYQITTAPSDRWTVHVRASLAGAESWWESGVHLSLLRAIDERGRKAAIAGDDIEGDGRHRFELQIAPGAKRLDLTFAVVKSRFVEFVVRPSLGYRGQGR